MKLPDPTPGLVIRFDYTWHKDHFKKERPCAIDLASSGTGMVTVVPITHSYPDIGEEDQSLQVPEDVCKAMGLDEDINYVRLSPTSIVCQNYRQGGQYNRPCLIGQHTSLRTIIHNIISYPASRAMYLQSGLWQLLYNAVLIAPPISAAQRAKLGSLLESPIDTMPSYGHVMLQ